MDLLSKEIGAVPRMLETGMPRGRDLHRGSISATAFGNGLSLHTVDVIDLEDFTTEILMPASLSICFLLNGGVAMGSGEEQFTLGSVDGATAAPEGGYFSLAQPGKFWRKAEKGRRLRAAVVVVSPEWLSDRGAESSTVAEALNSRPTSHGSWNLSPREILLAEQLLQPPQFEPFLHNLLLESRTMEAMLLDLSTETGQAILARLATQADLVTFNGTEAQLDALSLDIAHLSGLNPAIVLTQVSAFGGPKRPGGGQRKGFDEVLQAATGVMHRLKRENTPPEEYAHYGTIDAATGVWGAVAAVAGLLQANTTGKGGQVGTSLAAGAAAVQMPFLWASERAGTAPDPAGAMPPRSAIAGRIEGDDYVSPDGKREPLARYPDLRARLALGVTDDAHATGFIRHADHPAGTVELVTQCAIRCREAPLVAVGDPSKYGSDTRDVLTRLGMSESEIGDAFSSRAVAESWPDHERFLPD
ncbi:CoA transferase [Shinella zoogloeoides]|uniref:CoA transferase n=1 Tax=Shinella zoogloeoides TaxID=352475 RepID=UPI0028AC0C83|nr:CoA transferase [Shinella zoogloeoides]